MNEDFENSKDEHSDDEFYKKYFKEYYFIKTHFREFIFIVLILWIIMFFLVGPSKIIDLIKNTPLPIWGILLCVGIVIFDYYKGNDDE